MTDHWREIPTQAHYPGLTELTRDGRSIASMGTGAAVRQAIVERMERGRAETLG